MIKNNKNAQSVVSIIKENSLLMFLYRDAYFIQFHVCFCDLTLVLIFCEMYASDDLWQTSFLSFKNV